MKTHKIDLRVLRNDEHFQFNTEFRDLLTANNPAALKVAPQFEAYLTLYAQEDEALKKIIKSAITANIQDADHQRDLTFRGMIDANKSALKHFRPETVTAAKRLQVVFDTYGNVARKPLNEETSAVYNILQELKGVYEADVTTVGIADWVQELETNNKAFDELVKGRYDEAADRTELVLRQVRIQVDTAYRSIIERIDAFAIVEESDIFTNFIRRWNVVIEKYSNTLARRQGKRPLSPSGEAETPDTITN